MNLEQIAIQTTVKAAIEASKFIGKNDPNVADKASTEAMRNILSDQNEFDFEIVIGEGERDEAPMLYIGEKLGNGKQKMEIAVDPLEGTNLCAKNLPNSTTVIAIGEKILHAPDIYMKKISLKSEYSKNIDLLADIEENIATFAKNSGKNACEIKIMVLRRERHNEIIGRIQKYGANIVLIDDCDVNAVMLSATSDEVDIYYGIGGAPEGVLAACALKTLGGHMQGQLYCINKTEIQRANAKNIDLQKILTIKDMVPRNVIFSMTGVTDGNFCKGVKFEQDSIMTETILLNSYTKNEKFIRLKNNLENL